MSNLKNRIYTKSLPPIPEQENNRPHSKHTNVKPPLWRIQKDKDLEETRHRNSRLEAMIEHQSQQLEDLSTKLYKERQLTKLYESFTKIALNKIQRIETLLITAREDGAMEYINALDTLTAITNLKTNAVQEEINTFKEALNNLREKEGNNEDDKDIYKEEDYTDEEVIEGEDRIKIGFNIGKL